MKIAIQERAPALHLQRILEGVNGVESIQYTELMTFLLMKRFVRTAACFDYSDSLRRLRLGMHQVLKHVFLGGGLV